MEVKTTTPSEKFLSPSIVLVGNPNTGKSTLFNALTGKRQVIANYPGVTVSKKSGECHLKGRAWKVVDLPGSYSLTPRSPDEKITADALAGRIPDVAVDLVLCVVDASNLRRNLFLVSQVLELGRPTIVALTKMDLLWERGQDIDQPLLQENLGVPVVQLDVPHKQGIDQLQVELERLRKKLAEGQWRPVDHNPSQSERSSEFGSVSGNGTGPKCNESIGPALPVSESAETAARYAWIDGFASAVVTPLAASKTRERSTEFAGGPGRSWSDHLDPWLTHGLSGSLFFVAIMFVLFYAVFHVAGPAGDWVDSGLGAADSFVSAWIPAGMFRDLLVEGLIGGVGNFLVFLPQIFVLFLFIGLLESTGYMARAAYLMDRVFSPLGLSGKSFVPLLSSFACAIPGVMATRIIERPRDRLLTIMIAPLMSCSARLPVYSIMISAIVAGAIWLQAVVMLAMYFLGVVVALAIVVIFKKLIWREPSPEFVMELPELQFPNVSEVLRRTCERSGEFVVRAGTIILALTILIWAANYFPRNDQAVAAQVEKIGQLESQLEGLADNGNNPAHSEIAAQLQQLQVEVKSIRQEQSYLGQAGKWIAPVVKPLGWDWRIGCAALASFPAREVIVTTLGILYEVVEPDDNTEELELALQQATWPGTDRPVFTVPVALSIMVFFALCSQCASTLAVIYQETKSVWWPLFSFVYMTVLAYIGAFLTYQIGTWIAG